MLREPASQFAYAVRLPKLPDGSYTHHFAAVGSEAAAGFNALKSGGKAGV